MTGGFTQKGIAGSQCGRKDERRGATRPQPSRRPDDWLAITRKALDQDKVEIDYTEKKNVKKSKRK